MTSNIEYSLSQLTPEYNNNRNYSHLLPDKIDNVDKLCDDMCNLIIHSKSPATWAKHFSAWKLYNIFCSQHKLVAWPSTEQIVRAFTTWALVNKGLKSSTVKSYISSITLGNTLLNQKTPFLADEIVKMLIKGGETLLDSKSTVKSKLSVNPHMVKIIGHRIATSDWKSLDKQVIWTAILTCFFTSCRMGELLGKPDPSKQLCWRHINFDQSDGALIFLPCTKTKGLKGEFVDLFKFEAVDYCPVANLTLLRNMLLELGIFSEHSSVFVLSDGNALTKQQLNIVLETFLSDIIDSENFKVTCHSFRTGIPTLLGEFGPEMSDSIKEWGRWSSNCFSLYTKNVRARRKCIFDTVSNLLAFCLK